MPRSHTPRIEMLRRIHGSIERVHRELAGRAPAEAVAPTVAELRAQQRHVAALVTPAGDPRALLDH